MSLKLKCKSMIIMFTVILVLLCCLFQVKATAENSPPAEQEQQSDIDLSALSSVVSKELKGLNQKIEKKAVEELKQIAEEEQKREHREALLAGSEMVEKEDLEYLYENTDSYSYDALYQIATDLYDMDETTFNVCLGWFAGDNLEGQDDYWSYLSACVPINYLNRYGAESLKQTYLYSSWAASTEYYSYAAYSGRASSANEYIRKLFYIALTHLDPNPIEADGVCVENGYNTSRTITNAYYATTATWFHTLPIGGSVGVAGVWK